MRKYSKRQRTVLNRLDRVNVLLDRIFTDMCSENAEGKQWDFVSDALLSDKVDKVFNRVSAVYRKCYQQNARTK